MDRLHLMSVFVRVAETGSFTRAAEGLGVSRAAVSVAVQQLETHLGARLLHRTTRRVSLTPEGEVFHERCLRMLADFEEAEQLFRKGSGGLSGALSVDVPTRIAHRVIIPALPDFLARHPELEVRLGASDRSIDLLEQGVDAVLRVGELPDSSLVARGLGTFVQVNCASPEYIARHGMPTSVDDLDEHVAVNYSPRFSGSAEWDYVHDGQALSRQMRGMLTVDSAEAYIASCLAGLGLIQVPGYDVRDHLDSGALVMVLSDHPAPPLPVSIVYPTRKHVPDRVRVFTEWVARLFEERGLFQQAFV